MASTSTGHDVRSERRASTPSDSRTPGTPASSAGGSSTNDPHTPEHQKAPYSLSAQTPPPAPKAPSRSYRLRSSERSPIDRSIARRLTFGDDTDETACDPASLPAHHRKSPARRSSLRSHSDHDPSEASSSAMPALLSLRLGGGDEFASPAGRKLLGSPVSLHDVGTAPGIAPAPTEDPHFFRSASCASDPVRRPKRERQEDAEEEAQGREQEAQQEQGQERSIASSSHSLFPRPKRSCTLGAPCSNSKIPLVVRRRLYTRGSSSSSTVTKTGGPASCSPSLCIVELNRSNSCSGTDLHTTVKRPVAMPLRAYNRDTRAMQELDHDQSPPSLMSRSISCASYLAQTPTEVRPPRTVVAPTPPLQAPPSPSPKSSSAMASGRHHRSRSLLSRACSPSSRSSSPALHVAAVGMPMDYFGNWSGPSSLARAH